jgi:hypothetical protein
MKSAEYFSQLSHGTDFVLKIVIILKVLQLHMSLIMLFCNSVHVPVSGLEASLCYNVISTQNTFVFEESSLVNLVIVHSILS